MFARIDDSARAGELSSDCLSLLRVLAWHTTYSTGRVRPAICDEEELARLTGVTRRTVVTTLKKLVSAGWISTEYASSAGVAFCGNNKRISLLPVMNGGDAHE
jgi:DNA-binding MarR family transcriptional regulator